MANSKRCSNRVVCWGDGSTAMFDDTDPVLGNVFYQSDIMALFLYFGSVGCTGRALLRAIEGASCNILHPVDDWLV